VLGYQDANGNGQYDEGELYRLPYFGDLSDELQLTIEGIMGMMDGLGLALLDGGPEDAHPVVPDWFLLSDLNWVIDLIDIVFSFYGYDEMRLPPVPVPIGPLLYDPSETAVRDGVQAAAQFLYDYTAPKQMEVQP